MNLERVAEQLEFADARLPSVEHASKPRDLDIANPVAAHADHVMMSFEVSVVAGAVVEGGHLTGLADPAQSLERTVDRGQRDMRMTAAYQGVNLVGPRMGGRGKQGPDNGQALRRYRQSARPASGGELAQPALSVTGPARIVHHSEFHYQVRLNII